MAGGTIADPVSRRLRVYSFDPSVAAAHADLAMSEITLQLPWEPLEPGPVGEYIEVVDVDPAGGAAYTPVSLDDPRLLAQDGHAPSESNPQFHQQMAYAVAMATIGQFERALGRKVLWSTYREKRSKVQNFVRRLRLYPHALRERNAYYSPQKKAVLFGSFITERRDAWNAPGTFIHTVLSHDVVAHEVTHAILDGIHPRFAEPANQDVLAFHEAFADIVALFQHFAYPGVLKDQIGRTRGDLRVNNLLGQLAQQFGRASGRDSLRNYIGEQPDPTKLDRTSEPHDRGSILVAAVFGAFVTIYEARTRDLFRIATGGSGVLEAGAIHPDLAGRLAEEAARSALRMLQMCIRGVDYCPPFGLTFGDYLRAIVTADHDLNPEDPVGHRVAVVESFRSWGIHPRGCRSSSVESLLWPSLDQALRSAPAATAPEVMRQQRAEAAAPRRARKLRSMFATLQPDALETASESFGQMLDQDCSDRKYIWALSQQQAKAFHRWLETVEPEILQAIGIVRDGQKGSVFRSGGEEAAARPYAIEVHSVRTANRAGRDGWPLSEVVVELTQRRRGYFDLGRQQAVDSGQIAVSDDELGDFRYRAGCTLLIDPTTLRFRRVIRTAGDIDDDETLGRMRAFLSGGSAEPANAFDAPFAGLALGEPFAMLHRGDH